MIEINLYEQIRYLYAVEKLSKREIARRLGVSRNTVKRYCEGENVPWERKPRQGKCPVTNPIRETVKEWLESDREAPAKQQHTAQRIYERLVNEQGFTGSYSTIRKLVRELRPKNLQAYIPLEFDPGEATQVDWGQAVVIVNGERIRVNILCFRLCYSCAPYVAVFPNQSSDNFLAGHVLAFNFFGGVSKRLIYDNLKTAVKDGWGKYVQSLQKDFLALRSHYAFQADFCNPGAAHEKGLVEGLVGYIRRNIFVPVPNVNAIEELQPELDKRCLKYQDKHLQYRPTTVKEALTLEQQHLTTLPAREFDYARTRTAEVDSLSLVKFDRNRYSVPVALAGKTVTVKGYPFQVKIYYRSREIACHPRCYQQNKTRLEWEHYLPLLVKKPRSLQNALPLRQAVLPPGLNQLKEHLLARAQSYELAQVLGLVMEHGVEAVEEAIVQALAANQYSFQAVHYYLTSKKKPVTCQLELETGLPQVKPVDLHIYDQLLGGAAR